MVCRLPFPLASFLVRPWQASLPPSRPVPPSSSPSPMATEAIEQVAENAEQPAAPKSKRGVLILGVAGILVGTAAGLFGVGPVLAKRHSEAPAKKSAEHEKASASVVHAIENLVLNPAGSGGTRFLMVNATFELKDASAEELMKDHEAEVRDHILALLGKKTVEELSDMNQRD